MSAAVPGDFVIILDAVIINGTLASIRRSPGRGLPGLQRVADGYTLMIAALLLSFGAPSNRRGRWI